MLKWLERRGAGGPSTRSNLPAPWPGAALGFHAAANGEMAASWPWSTLLARADEVIE